MNNNKKCDHGGLKNMTIWKGAQDAKLRTSLNVTLDTHLMKYLLRNVLNYGYQFLTGRSWNRVSSGNQLQIIRLMYFAYSCTNQHKSGWHQGGIIMVSPTAFNCKMNRTVSLHQELGRWWWLPGRQGGCCWRYFPSCCIAHTLKKSKWVLKCIYEHINLNWPQF